MLLLLIIVSCLVLQLFLPWWIIGPVAFAFAAWKSTGASHAFKSGFLAVLLLWSCIALLKTIPNENLLAGKIAKMLMLPDLQFSWLIVLLISALVGALAAGFAALAGYFFRNTLTAKTLDKLSLHRDRD